MGRQCGGEVGKAIGHFVRLSANPHFAKLALLGTRHEPKGGIEVRSFRAARPYMCVYIYIYNMCIYIYIYMYVYIKYMQGYIYIQTCLIIYVNENNTSIIYNI